MNFRDYSERATRTIPLGVTRDDLLKHSLFGLASEVGELQGIYQKYYQGHDIELEEVMEELGDILWFLNEFCVASDIDLEGVACFNIYKLKQRYPDGFDVDRSVNRSEEKH